MRANRGPVSIQGSLGVVPEGDAVHIRRIAQLEEVNKASATSATRTLNTPSNVPTTPEAAIPSIFSEDDGKLTLLVQDLKAATQKDYTQRLVHITLHARKILFKETNTARQQVYEVTDFAGLDRHNVTSYIAQDNNVDRDGDMLSLKIGGIQHARKCLLEIVEPTTAGQWLPDADVRPAGKPRKVGKRGDGQTEDQIAGAVNHSETQALARDIPHELFVGMSVLDKAIVALYGLRKAGIEAEVFPGSISEYLYKAFHHQVDSDTIGKALRRAPAPNNTYVVYKEGVGYRITPSGIAFVESEIRATAGSAPAVEQQELTAQQPELAES